MHIHTIGRHSFSSVIGDRHLKTLSAFIFSASLIGVFLAGAPASPRVIADSKESAPRKRALLIGISKYSRPKIRNRWPDLNTGAEIDLLRGVLREKFSFQNDDIVSLKDDEATGDAIIGAFEDLISKTAPGDVAFIHFSGHGDTIDDDNGDEVDGLDEVLVPFDYGSRRSNPNVIRDDRIDSLLRRLSQKKPASVMVSIDTCYAGSVTRDASIVRGGASGGLRSENESPSGFIERSTQPPANFVYFTAARANQKAGETFLASTDTIVGVYSDALLSALSESGPGTTYRDLYDKISERVLRKRRNQFPQFEGYADAAVLAGTAVEQDQFSRVGIHLSGPGFATLKRGSLQGVSAGSRFKLFPSGTRSVDESPASVLAEASVVETTALTSTLKLDRTLAPETLLNSWAFETEKHYGDSALSVFLDGLDSIPRKPDFATRLRAFNKTDFSPAKFVDAKDAIPEQADFRLYKRGRDLILERRDRSLVAVFSDMSTAESELMSTLKREYIRSLIGKLGESADSRLKVDIRLIRVNPEFSEGGRLSRVSEVTSAESEDRSASLLRIGEYVMLEVTNRGESDAYIGVLNLRADGRIAAAFPHPQAGGGDNLIKKGARVRIPLPYLFRITGPVGPESFHLIATTEPIDLSFLLDRELRGGTEVSTANSNPLTDLLRSIGSGRRTRQGLSAPGIWSISSSSFLVSK